MSPPVDPKIFGQTHDFDGELFRHVKGTRKPTAVDGIVRTFKMLLATGKLKPGDRLPNEQVLTETFDTSRGTLREAIKILSAYGVIDVRRGDATYISEVSGPKIIDLLLFQMMISKFDRTKLRELREFMEVGMVAFVLRHITDEDMEKIEQVHLEFVSLNDSETATPEEIARADIAFHREIARSIRNDLIFMVYMFTMMLLNDSIIENKTRRKDNAVMHHTHILEQLRLRDEQGVKRCIMESIDEWMELAELREQGL